jgi:hypothetical protein
MSMEIMKVHQLFHHSPKFIEILVMDHTSYLLGEMDIGIQGIHILMLVYAKYIAMD